MKKLISTTLCVLLALLLLAACGSKAPEAASTAPLPASAPQSAPAKAAGKLQITLYNSSDYNFHEIYISPTASNAWGADFLGSTNLLKKNGSFDLELEAYDYDNYDVMVVDEDDDVYKFSYVTLLDGTSLYIGFVDGTLHAVVSHADGSEEDIIGTLEGSGGNTGGDTPTPAPTGTGNDTNGAYSFTVYNESPFEIYAIYCGVAGASAEYDQDILPAILAAGDSTEVNGLASQGDWMNTEWTLFIEDVDGDVSQTFETFNPWVLAYVDIHWDSANGGYYCEFVY